MMDKLRIQCDFPFPLIKERFSISHSLIEKPSGLSYLLLVTIEHSDTMGDWDWIRFFEELGIQKEVYPLMVKELLKLVQREIIICNDYLVSDESCLYKKISSFQFTEKGMMVFRDKQIPSDVPGKTESDAYFKPYDQSWVLGFNSDRFETHPIFNSALSEEFVLGFKPQDEESVKELFEKKRGSTELGIKKDEEILDITKISDSIPWYIKIEGELDFADSFSVSFKDGKIQKFFDENYSSSLVNHIIELKSKFSIGLSASVVSWKSLSSFAVSGITTPDQLNKILQRRSKLSLYSGEEFAPVNATRKVAASLPLVSNDATIGLSFATFEGEHGAGYLLAKLECDYKQDGKVYVPALVQFALPKEWFADRVRESLKDVEANGYEEIKDILDLTQTLDDCDFFTSKLSEYLPSDPSDSLSRLYPLRELISDEKFKQVFGSIAKDRYLSLIDEKLTVENYTDYLAGASWVVKSGMVRPSEALEKICEKLGGVVDSTRLFSTLKQVFFSEKDIVEFVNPLDALDDETIYDDPTLMKANRVISDLKELTGLVGTETPFDYTYVEDISLVDKIRPLLNDAKENIGSISVLKPRNVQRFKEWNDWIETFDTILAKLNVLTDSSLADCSKEKLEGFAKKGDFFKVCISLCQRISDWLSEKLSMERSDLLTLLKQAESMGVLTSEQIDFLQALRVERNKYAHPSEERKPSADKDDLSKWIDLVFDITKEEKE